MRELRIDIINAIFIGLIIYTNFAHNNKAMFIFAIAFGFLGLFDIIEYDIDEEEGDE